MLQLELTAALISTQLASHLQGRYNVYVSKVYLWSDSQIVLHWLQSTTELKPFIANHVRKMKVLTSVTNSTQQRYQIPATYIIQNLEKRTFLATTRIPMAFFVPNMCRYCKMCTKARTSPTHRSVNLCVAASVLRFVQNLKKKTGALTMHKFNKARTECNLPQRDQQHAIQIFTSHSTGSPTLPFLR